MPDPTQPEAARSSCTAIGKHYGISRTQLISAADDVSLSIGPGEFVALTGASGSGKSTLLHIIGAIERPDCGTVVVDGTTVTGLRGARWPPTGAAWASCSSATTCCRPSPRWTT